MLFRSEDTISIIGGLGAGLCEVFFEAGCEYEGEFIRLLSERLSEYSVRTNSVHAFCANFEQQLFSDYQRRRTDALAVYRRVLEASSALGAKSYTFHGDKRSDNFNEIDFKHYGRCYDELLSIADGYGVSLGLENVVRCQPSRPEFIENLRNVIKNDGLKFTLDIKQAYRAKKSVYEYIDVMGRDIVNIHINDFLGEQTCLLPGTGGFDFTEFFGRLKAAGYSGNAIIEVYSSNYHSMEELSDSFEYIKNIVKQGEE